MANDNTNAVYIQQLRKYCKENKKWNEIFPVTFIQAIYNAANGNRLDTLLAMYNSIFVEYKGSFATTVAAIDNIVRKKGLIITYFDENNLSWTRRYKLHDISDINFQNEDNWEGYNFDILIDEIYKAIEYIFSNIDKFPDLKNVLIQQITEVTENIFNNIEDYANLYNIFKTLIKENINNVFNNINNYSEFKNLINININNRVDYIFNNIDDFEVLLNKINIAILNRVDYIFNNIDKYPELKQLIINSLQSKQLFTIEFSVNGDTLNIINKGELEAYIENNNINNNALVTFIGKFFDAFNNKLLYNLVFTAFINTNSSYIQLDNCYGETLAINNGKLYKYKINFNIDTETEMSNPNWITYTRKYDDIPTFEFNYVSTNIYSISDIEDYNKYVNSFKANTLVRFIFNENSSVIDEYIGYINKVGSTLRVLIYLQENSNFVSDTIISGIIENNELRISRLSNGDILTYLYNANSSGGVVLLDNETLIPSRFLPSYVDDVIDLLGGIVETTPTSEMTTGYKYYVTSTKKIFTASSATSGITSDPVSDVIYVVPDDTNGAIMYRWSGTNLVEIVNGGIVIGTTIGTAFDGFRGLNNENILKSVPNKLITDVSVIAQGPNDDVIIRTTYSERTNNNGSYTANKYKDYELPEANQGRAGLMSSSDKVKLDSIYNEYIINDEKFFSVTQGEAFTLTTWGKSNFIAFRDAIFDGKKVELYLSSYDDGAEANINVPCEVAVSDKTLIITYVIPDLLKQVKATLTINDNNDNVSCSITNVINLTEVGSGLTIGTTSGTAFEGNRGLQAEKDIDKLQSYTNNGVVSNVESSSNSSGELKVTRRINDGGAIITSEQYIALPQSSSSKAGLMSSSDKVKLDSIYNEYIINDEKFFSVTQGEAFTLTTWGKSNFIAFRDAIFDGKKVELYLSSYDDGAEANINVPCEVAVSDKTLIITYVIPDLLKQVKATLTINDNNDNVSCSITNVINLTEVGSGLTIGTTSGTAFEGNRGLQAEKDIDKLQSYTNNGVVSNVESSSNSSGELKVTRRINDGGAIITSEQYIALPQSSSSKAGLMSSSDKVKLDNIYIVKLTGNDLTSNGETGDINNTDISVSDFNTLLESLNDGKNVRVFIAEYSDGAEQTFNINCDIAFNYNTKIIYLQYDIYDLNKRFYSILYTYNNRVVLEINTVKDKYTKFYYIDSNILYNPTKGQSGNLSASQFSIQQFDELVSDIQKRKDFCVYSTIFASKNSDVKYYRYTINCIVNSNTQLLCNYINPLDNSYVKFIMNKNTANVEIIINQKYNIINTVDVLNTVMSGLVLKPTSGNQFETNQRYSSSDTLIQLINKFIQNSGYNDFRIVHSPTTINFVFGTTIDNSNSVVNVLSFVSNLSIGTPKINVYTKTINFTEVAELTYSELNTLIRDGTWQTFSLDLTTIGGSSSGYTLPTASSTTLGGIKIPSNGQLTIDNNGNLYPNVATSNNAGIVKPVVGSGLLMNGSSISVSLGRRDINLGTLTPGSTINGGHYYIYNDTVIGNASPTFNLNNNINSWNDPLAIIIVNRKNTGGIRFEGTNINMLTITNDCTKIGAIFIRYFQNANENGYFVWAIPKIIQ